MLLTLCHNCYAGTFYVQGFESNSKNVFIGEHTTNGSVSVSSTQASTGTYSLACDIDVAGGYAMGRFEFADGGGIDTMYIRLRFFCDSDFMTSLDTNGDHGDIFALADSGYAENLRVMLQNVSGSNKVVIYYDVDGDFHTATSSNTWTGETWQTLEIYIDHSSTEAGVVKVWINGSLGIDVTGDTGANNSHLMWLSNGIWSSTSVTGIIYIDDVVMDDSNYIGTGWRIQEGVAYGGVPYF